MSKKSKILIAVGIVVAVGAAFAVNQILYLQKAHSTFDNYYAFRGCVELLRKTDTYGLCRLALGQVIKIVEYDNRWFLDGDLPWGATAATSTESGIEYINGQYGFSFSLPQDWVGYSVVTSTWEGYAVNAQGNVPAESGPMISIRNPKWTSQEHYQDIPIMIFTLAQWDSLTRDEFHIGAAPINPSLLNFNADYVFALPARYNFAFPAGFEEVDKIIQSKPLQPLPSSKTTSAPTGILPYDSGIRGTVMLGPTCPVERIPPDPNCAPKPYQTLVAVFRASDAVHAFAIGQSDASGTFSFSLPPGDYVLGAGESNLPRCDHPTVSVAPGVYASANVLCDTGIR